MTDNPFRRFWDLGYRRLVPIVPPGAPLSEHSVLHRRLTAGEDARGKSPGVRWPDGSWSGFDWLPHEADEHDLDRWAAMGAGVGIKTGDGLVLVDADTLAPEHAAIIRAEVERHFGHLPIRIGREPKAGYLVRVADAVPYLRVEFGERDAAGRLRDRVEILSGGRQFVAEGIHPTTLQPYRWPGGVPALADVPETTAAALTAFLADLRPLLPAASDLRREGAGAASAVDPAVLRGDPDAVERAVRATPNTSARFPTRESYRDFGYAIKAALPDDEDRAFDLWSDWCARWSDGVNDPGIVAADWRRMKPPFRRGASWLYDIAEEASGGAFRAAEAWFEPIETPDNPFAQIAQAATTAAAAAEPIRWIDPRDWQGVQPPTREWEVEGWIPKGEVTLLYGDGGIGKTLVAHQYAAAAAAGQPWLGQPTRQARVMCFFCEDSEAELQRRQIGINAALGIDYDDLGGRLRIASRKYLDNIFALWDRHTGAMKRQAVWEQLRADAMEWKADVLILDTLADTFGGSEIDRAQVNAFVKSCLGRLAADIGGSVLALGHPSLSGKSSGSGTSGSTAWNNAARSRLFLRYPKGVEKGDVRELEGMKANYGPKGNLLKLRWHRGAFDVIAGTTARTEIDPGPLKGETATAPIAAYPSVEDDADRRTLEALGEAEAKGLSLSMSNHSPNYAPRVLRAYGLVDAHELETDPGRLAEAIARLLRAGHVREGEIGRSAQRKPVRGLLVARVGAPTAAAGAPESTGEDVFG